jgi:hypothetical protein
LGKNGREEKVREISGEEKGGEVHVMAARVRGCVFMCVNAKGRSVFFCFDGDVIEGLLLVLLLDGDTCDFRVCIRFVVFGVCLLSLLGFFFLSSLVPFISSFKFMSDS